MKKNTRKISILLAIALFINIFGNVIPCMKIIPDMQVAQGAQIVQDTQGALSKNINTKSNISDKREIKVGDNISGFTLESKKWLSDIQSTSMIFRHNKSGAKLIY